MRLNLKSFRMLCYLFLFFAPPQPFPRVGGTFGAWQSLWLIITISVLNCPFFRNSYYFIGLVKLKGVSESPYHQKGTGVGQLYLSY